MHIEPLERSVLFRNGKTLKTKEKNNYYQPLKTTIMDKKFIYAGIPLLALLFTILTPLISVWGFGANLIDFFDGYAGLAICFLIVGLGVAYCGFVGKYMKWAPYLMLLPFLWLHIGVGAWFWIIFTIAEIVLVLKPELLDKLGNKKE